MKYPRWNAISTSETEFILPSKSRTPGRLFESWRRAQKNHCQMLSTMVSIPDPGTIHSVDLTRNEDFNWFSGRLQYGWKRFDHDPKACLRSIITFCRRVTDSGIRQAMVNRRALGFWMPDSNRIYIRRERFALALRRSKSSVSNVFHASGFVSARMSEHKSEFVSGLGSNEDMRCWSVRIMNPETPAGLWETFPDDEIVSMDEWLSEVYS
jgi:hypothetical protein